MNSFFNTLRFFLLITVELTVLFIAISALVALILMYIPQEKIKVWMSGKGILGNFIGAFVGALTPFCACSTIPLTLGFLEAGISFGPIMSFVIASPLLNPIILAMLVALMGWQTSIVYFIVVFGAAVIFGAIIERAGGIEHVKNVRIKGGGYQSDVEAAESFVGRLKLSIDKAWGDYRAVLVYLIIGVAIGSIIYGYIPQELVVRIAGPRNLFAVPVAAVIGIPLYIRAETAIPIGVALMQKGMTVGAVIALIIGGAGMAIPEMSLLASIFKKKLVGAIVAIIFLTAVIGGYVFNIVL